MHRKSIARAAVALATITLGTSVWAGGNAERGKEKATQICAACHGLDGISQNPIYPHIGGQYQDYLLHALEGYKAGTRQNAIMQGIPRPTAPRSAASSSTSVARIVRLPAAR